MTPSPSLSWWQRLLQAFGSMPPADPLPRDAQQELDRWSPEDIEEYENSERDAPPDAPHIDEGGI